MTILFQQWCRKKWSERWWRSTNCGRRAGSLRFRRGLQICFWSGCGTVIADAWICRSRRLWEQGSCHFWPLLWSEHPNQICRRCAWCITSLRQCSSRLPEEFTSAGRNQATTASCKSLRHICLLWWRYTRSCLCSCNRCCSPSNRCSSWRHHSCSLVAWSLAPQRWTALPGNFGNWPCSRGGKIEIAEKLWWGSIWFWCFSNSPRWRRCVGGFEQGKEGRSGFWDYCHIQHTCQRSHCSACRPQGSNCRFEGSGWSWWLGHTQHRRLKSEAAPEVVAIHCTANSDLQNGLGVIAQVLLLTNWTCLNWQRCFAAAVDS